MLLLVEDQGRVVSSTRAFVVTHISQDLAVAGQRQFFDRREFEVITVAVADANCRQLEVLAITRPGGLRRVVPALRFSGCFLAVETENSRARRTATSAHAAPTTAAGTARGAGRGWASDDLRLDGNLFIVLRNSPGHAFRVLHSWVKALALRFIQRPGAGEIGRREGAGGHYGKTQRSHQSGDQKQSSHYKNPPLNCGSLVCSIETYLRVRYLRRSA